MTSEEPNPTGGAFLDSTEDVDFAGQIDAMAIIGSLPGAVSIAPVIKRENSNDEEPVPVLNIERDPRVPNPPREELQVYDPSCYQVPAVQPELVTDQVPGADDIIKIEEAEPDYLTSFRDRSWIDSYMKEQEETEGATIMPLVESPATDVVNDMVEPSKGVDRRNRTEEGTALESGTLHSDAIHHDHHSSAGPSRRMLKAARKISTKDDHRPKERVDKEAMHTSAGPSHQKDLDQGEDIEKADEKGRTALYHAVKRGEEEVLRLLIRKGASLDTKTSTRSWTALQKAIAIRQTTCAKILVDNGCDVNIQNVDGETPLHIVVYMMRNEMVVDGAPTLFDILINSGRVKLDILNKNGLSVFHVAVEVGNLRVVQHFLELQNAAEFVLEVIPKKRLNPLHIACRKGHLKIAKLLLDFVENMDKESMERNDLGRFLNSRQQDDLTPLMLASVENHYSLIELLVNFKADIDVTDRDGDTALTIIMMNIGRNKSKSSVPNLVDSPEIFQIYKALFEISDFTETMEKYPTLAAACYLISVGADPRGALSQSNETINRILNSYVPNHYCLMCGRLSSPLLYECCKGTDCMFCSDCALKIQISPCCKKRIQRQPPAADVPTYGKELSRSPLEMKTVSPTLASSTGGSSSEADVIKLNDPPRLMILGESATKYLDIPHSWLCTGRLLRLHDPSNANNDKLFRESWKRGQPVMVSGVTKSMDMSIWHPESFLKEFGDHKNDLVNCLTGKTVPNQPMTKFWEGFEHLSERIKDEKGQPMLLKTKDWPPVDDFAELLSTRFLDFIKALPLPVYTHPTGCLNLVAHTPDCSRPNLGPRMDVAYGSAPLCTKGTTDLHLDVSDTVSVMVHIGLPKEANGEEHKKEVLKAIEDSKVDILTRSRVEVSGEIPGALWHIYHARDAHHIEHFLNRVDLENGRLETQHDPNHGKVWYLDDELRTRLYKEHGVREYTIVQCLGDAVFIPAGAPYQVCNLNSCIKVTQGFVSPETFGECFKINK